MKSTDSRALLLNAEFDKWVGGEMAEGGRTRKRMPNLTSK